MNAHVRAPETGDPADILREAHDRLIESCKALTAYHEHLTDEIATTARRLAEAERARSVISAAMNGSALSPVSLPVPAAPGAELTGVIVIKNDRVIHSEAFGSERALSPAEGAPLNVDGVLEPVMVEVPEADERATPAGIEPEERAASAAEPTVPGRIDHAVEAERALEIAQRLAPSRTPRQQKMMAGAALTVAFGLTRKEAATATQIGSADLSPSFLAAARIKADEIEIVANELKAPAATPEIAESDAEPETPADATGDEEIAGYAEDLVNDLDRIRKEHHGRAERHHLADWLGTTGENVDLAVEKLARDGVGRWGADGSFVLTEEA